MDVFTRVGGRITVLAGREYLAVGSALVEIYYRVHTFPRWRANRNNLISSFAAGMDMSTLAGGEREKVG
jgi:hypothetical protein